MDLVDYGVQGLEVYHPVHTGDDVAKYKEIAERKGLFITGGTDCHGGNNGADISHFGMCGLASADYSILSFS